MLLIGLTGALATGKSTVAALLSTTHNLPLIDADLLARAVVAPGTTGYTRILAHFGESTPDLLLPASADASGSGAGKGEERMQGARGALRPINRAVLGRRVFGDDAERRRDRAVLNGIVHPLVRWEMAKLVLWYYVLGHWAVVLDIPLLYESGLDVFMGVVVMVAVADSAVQMRRLRERDKGLSEGEARERVGSQMGVREKVGRTRGRGGRGWVVWNDGGRGELGGEVGGVVRELRERWGGWWGGWLWVSPVVAGGMGVWVVWRGWRCRREWEKGEGKRL